MSAPKHISKKMLVRSGAKARSFVGNDGIRLYAPWKVTMEVQLSPLLICTDTLDFYVYAESGAVASKVAGRMLQLWQAGERVPFDGYPKPAGRGQNAGISLARPISDKEFESTWKQALNEGKEVRRAMNQQDPTGFHIKPKSTIVYVPGTRN